MKRQTAEPLPPACGFCAPYGGLWRIAAGGGLKRCGCARGARLAAADAARTANTMRPFLVVRDGKLAACGDRA
jgi:hypothetical protein